MRKGRTSGKCKIHIIRLSFSSCIQFTFDGGCAHPSLRERRCSRAAAINQQRRFESSLSHEFYSYSLLGLLFFISCSCCEIRAGFFDESDCGSGYPLFKVQQLFILGREWGSTPPLVTKYGCDSPTTDQKCMVLKVRCEAHET